MKEKFTFFLEGPFSNFYPAYFMDLDGISYSCSEQYYMAKKALFFDDPYRYLQILDERNPKEQKKHGRKVIGFGKNIWDGTNWLGEILTNIREDLIIEEKKRELF